MGQVCTGQLDTGIGHRTGVHRTIRYWNGIRICVYRKGRHGIGNRTGVHRTIIYWNGI